MYTIYFDIIYIMKIRLNLRKWVIHWYMGYLNYCFIGIMYFQCPEMIGTFWKCLEMLENFITMKKSHVGLSIISLIYQYQFILKLAWHNNSTLHIHYARGHDCLMIRAQNLWLRGCGFKPWQRHYKHVVPLDRVFLVTFLLRWSDYYNQRTAGPCTKALARDPSTHLLDG